MDAGEHLSSSPPLPQEAGQISYHQSPPESRPTSPPMKPPRDGSDAVAGRHRSNSGRQPLQQPINAPIQDAVTNAFDDTVSAKQVNPELIAIVTEQVIKNLQNVNLVAMSATSTQPQPQSQHVPPLSPTLSSTASASAKLTPPASPERRYNVEIESEDESVSPHGFSHDRAQSTVYEEDSPTSPGAEKQQFSQPTYAPASDPRESLRRSDPSPKRSSDFTTDDHNRGASPRRDSSVDRNQPRKGDMRFADTRPAASSAHMQEDAVDEGDGEGGRGDDGAEETTLEKIWRPLFENGKPTMRLGQFLKGLALHLTSDYEPHASLVISPAKMLRFLDETRPTVPEEYPWTTIFGGRMTGASISAMYRKLLCEHHMVQNPGQYHEQPAVPALTPNGFEKFMTCLIQAHPHIEFERLESAVQKMPISNADDKSERFPKSLSRRLLPARSNIQAVQRLVASLAHEPHLIQLKNRASMPPPPSVAVPPQAQSSQAAGSSVSNGKASWQAPLFTERERKPYGQNSFNAVEDDDLRPQTSRPIERERKPYTGREGAGKVYTSDEERQQRATRPKPVPPGNSQQSTAAPQQPPSLRKDSNLQGASREQRNGPPSPRSSRSRIGPSQPPLSSSTSYGKSNPRPRSPPSSNQYRPSEAMNTGSGSFEYGNSFDPRNASSMRDSYTGDQDYDARRYSRARSRANAADNDEEGRIGKPIPRRNGSSQNANYESSYGIPGASGGSSSLEKRRRSMFSGANTIPGNNFDAGGGGTDGYGSFAGSNAQYAPPPSQQQQSQQQQPYTGSRY